jgi:hypothetical protein
MCSGSRGWAARRSIATKLDSSTTLAPSAMIVALAVQDWVSAFENP